MIKQFNYDRTAEKVFTFLATKPLHFLSKGFL